MAGGNSGYIASKPRAVADLQTNRFACPRLESWLSGSPPTNTDLPVFRVWLETPQQRTGLKATSPPRMVDKVHHPWPQKPPRPDRKIRPPGNDDGRDPPQPDRCCVSWPGPADASWDGLIGSIPIQDSSDPPGRGSSCSDSPQFLPGFPNRERLLLHLLRRSKRPCSG